MSGRARSSTSVPSPSSGNAYVFPAPADAENPEPQLLPGATGGGDAVLSERQRAVSFGRTSTLERATSTPGETVSGATVQETHDLGAAPAPRRRARSERTPAKCVSSCYFRCVFCGMLWVAL